MNRMRELEVNVHEALADLLGPEFRKSPLHVSRANDFLFHLSQWIDERAREVIDPTD